MLLVYQVTKLAVVDPGEGGDQRTDELDLAVAHDPAQPFEDGLGIAFALVAGELPKIRDGAAGRHNHTDGVLTVLHSGHDPEHAFPLGAGEIGDDEAITHDLVSLDLPDTGIGFDGDLYVGANLGEAAAGMLKQTLLVHLYRRQHAIFHIIDAQASLNTCESRGGNQCVIDLADQVSSGSHGPQGCNLGGPSLGQGSWRRRLESSLCHSIPIPTRQDRRCLLIARQDLRFQRESSRLIDMGKPVIVDDRL